ncbi:uncharacterized protein LOC115191448 [Salmo trutta]|uniref:uncharacterized protein LOC115191448 n=1 Tax=Salmo trutta TaxID=8032 RepID=UPI0011314C02|nr:uncharacterized protein LOC115191448 [Salmo trutta]
MAIIDINWCSKIIIFSLVKSTTYPVVLILTFAEVEHKMGDNEENQNFDIQVKFEKKDNENSIYLNMNLCKQILINFDKEHFYYFNFNILFNYVSSSDKPTAFKEIILQKQNSLFQKKISVIYIQCFKDYVAVINFFWKKNGQLEEEYYIIVGRIISSFNMNNIYIKTEFEINDDNIESAINEGILNVSDIVIFKTIVDYATLDKKVSKSRQFRYALIDIIFGNQQKLLVIRNPYDMIALLAVSFSEVIRSQVMILIILISLTMDSLNTWSDFRKYLPLCGGTWKKKQENCQKLKDKIKMFFFKTKSETFSKVTSKGFDYYF